MLLLQLLEFLIYNIELPKLISKWSGTEINEGRKTVSIMHKMSCAKQQLTIAVYTLLFAAYSVQSGQAAEFITGGNNPTDFSLQANASAIRVRRERHGECQGCVCGVANRQNRIVGGMEADNAEFPWIVMLVEEGDPVCGGSLISNLHVLTAAHCFPSLKFQGTRALLGQHERDSVSPETVIRRIAHVAIHPQFHEATFRNDVGVLTMDRPVLFGPTIQSICLPPPGLLAEMRGEFGVVAGWGHTSATSKTSPTSLQKVTVPVVPYDECVRTEYTKKDIKPGMFCAGVIPMGGKDACQGDSGGPFMMRSSSHSGFDVVGIVSWGLGCGDENVPGVYTEVSDYRSWIVQQLEGECRCGPFNPGVVKGNKRIG